VSGVYKMDFTLGQSAGASRELEIKIKIVILSEAKDPCIVSYTGPSLRSG